MVVGITKKQNYIWGTGFGLDITGLHIRVPDLAQRDMGSVALKVACRFGERLLPLVLSDGGTQHDDPMLKYAESVFKYSNGFSAQVLTISH